MLLSASEPIPFSANTASIVTVPPIIWASRKPRTVTTGIAAFFSPCLSTIEDLVRPIPRFVRMWSRPSTSARADLSWTVSSAPGSAASAIAGRMRCLNHSHNPCSTPAYPSAGRYWRLMARAEIITSASQKGGMATATAEAAVMTRSTAPAGRSAAITPSVSEMSVAKTRATATNDKVTVARRQIKPLMLSDVCNDLPRSPWMAWPSHRPYRTSRGSSRPSSWRIFATCSGVGFSPARLTAASPGTRSTRTNTKNETMINSGTLIRSRRTTSFNIQEVVRLLRGIRRQAPRMQSQ